MVHRIAVPEEVRSFGLLDRIDYADAFEARTSTRHSPREWGDLIVERSSPAVLAFVRAVHAHVGRMPLLPQDAEHPLGWTILEEDDVHLVLGVDGGIATPRVVVLSEPGRVVFATVLRYETGGARAIWAVGRHLHRAVARHLVAAATRPADGQARGTRRSNRCLKWPRNWSTFPPWRLASRRTSRRPPEEGTDRSPSFPTRPLTAPA